jgi:arginine/lysine/ornithine decarboxylase
VIQSSHKTLTALSQAAMMHLGNEAFSFAPVAYMKNELGSDLNEIDGDNLEIVSNRSETQLKDESEEPSICGDVLHECFSLLTTTSPNTVLLASLGIF